MRHKGIGDFIADIQLRRSGAAAESGAVGTRAFGIEHQQIGLQRLEAALAHFAPDLTDIIQRAHRRACNHLAVEQITIAAAKKSAMRPVDGQSVSNRAAQQFINRDAQRLGLDIQAGIDHRSHGMRLQTAGGRTGLRVKHGVDTRHIARILADQTFPKTVDQPGEPLATARLVELRPADDALVGGDFQKREVFPTPIR